MEPIAPTPPPPPAARAPRPLGARLDAGLDVLRRQWVLLVGLSALLYVPAAFVREAAPPPGAEASAVAPGLGIALLFMLVAAPLVVASVIDACGAVVRGVPTDAGLALRRGLALALPLVATWLVLLAVLAVALIPLVAVERSGGALGALQAPARLAALALPFAVGVRLTLITQVAVLERRFAVRALVRAHQLISGQVLRAFGTLLLAGLLAGLLSGIAALAVGELPVVGPVATGLVQAVGFAYTSAVGVVVYDDVCVRRGESGLGAPVSA